MAVTLFNDGSSVLTDVLKELDIIPGRHYKKACAKLESDRIRHSRRKSGEPARKRRKQLRKDILTDWKQMWDHHMRLEPFKCIQRPEN